MWLRNANEDVGLYIIRQNIGTIVNFTACPLTFQINFWRIQARDAGAAFACNPNYSELQKPAADYSVCSAQYPLQVSKKDRL